MNSKCIKLELNIAEFLAEYFMDRTGTKTELSYGLFWEAITDTNNRESIRISTNYEPKEDGSFFYEYGLLKAEEEAGGEHLITETRIDGVWGTCWTYNIHYENAEESPVSFYFYAKTRNMAFIQHEEETMNLAAEMRNITQQKPILCLESHSDLFHKALGEILGAAYDYYDKEELQRECCPDNTEVADWMRYKFACSPEYDMDHCGADAIGNIVGNAIDAAWTWFHTGYKNNFIRINPVTKELILNW